MTMSINTGLVSGMNTGQMVNDLMKLEAASQNALRTRLSNTQVTAAAYRSVNTTLAGLTTSAEALLKPATWTAAKGTSTSPGVTVTTTPAAVPGSLTFAVTKVATTASSVSTGRWATTTEAAGLTTLDVRRGGASVGTVALDGTESIAQIATKINADTALGLTASTVQVAPGRFALQISARTSGAAADFTVDGTAFARTSAGQDAELQVGTVGTGTTAYTVSSATNTFEGVLPGAAITVTKEEATPVTVSVASDPDAITAKVAGLFDSLNGALTSIRSQTSNAPGSTKPLRGEYAVTAIAGQLLRAVADAVGADGSPARIGIELTRNGEITFDKEKFAAALKSTPDIVQRMVSGTGVPGDAGIAGRVRDVTKLASDATTGTLTSLAKGQDSLARDIQDRIADWDVRLATRRQTLTRQFTAMESALSSLSNQSNWLAGQLSSLPKS